ncbi:protease modulator HflK [Entomomonas moraniae]|uniref:Protease modulator HflK n=1 Tax=Entomomonas moraniae TaxID=2213226 RepID=A0A3S9XFL6_9GAMM|nr:protease modulator HflK [Entomomonas moraniae]AZS51088.1 protease modulator HflK [Entomomonas moraniae]
MSNLLKQVKGKITSPWQQASRIAFLVLYGVVILTAIGWLLSNVRQIGPESRAVVFRMGEMVRVQDSGLLVAWPQPFEQVVILPSAGQMIEQKGELLVRSKQAQKVDSGYAFNNDATAGSGYLLTGDSGVVQLDIRAFYQVTDPYDFVLQGAHVIPALNRLIEHSAVEVCASRDLDTILVARPELIDNNSNVAESREKLRLDIQIQINKNLEALKQQNAGLGIRVERIDVQSSLPQNAVAAFNAVLTASQVAAQEVASAQNYAAQKSQEARQASDRILQVAHAQASERLAKAHTDTVIVHNLTKAKENHTDIGLLLRLYHDKVSAILAKAQSVNTVGEGDASHLIIDGAK